MAGKNSVKSWRGRETFLPGKGNLPATSVVALDVRDQGSVKYYWPMHKLQTSNSGYVDMKAHGPIILKKESSDMTPPKSWQRHNCDTITTKTNFCSVSYSTVQSAAKEKYVNSCHWEHFVMGAIYVIYVFLTSLMTSIETDLDYRPSSYKTWRMQKSS